MAGDEQPDAEISLEGPPSELTFRYSDLAFEEPDKVKYEQLQKLTTTLKMSHTWHINLSLNEAKTQFNKPHTEPLTKAFDAQRNLYITTSQAKLDNIIQTYQELSTFVTSFTFPEPQISNLTTNIDYHQAKALNAHTAFIASLHICTECFF